MAVPERSTVLTPLTFKPPEVTSIRAVSGLPAPLGAPSTKLDSEPVLSDKPPVTVSVAPLAPPIVLPLATDTPPTTQPRPKPGRRGSGARVIAGVVPSERTPPLRPLTSSVAPSPSADLGRGGDAVDAAVGQPQRAAADGRVAGVGVGIGQDQRAGAGFGDAETRAADRAERERAGSRAVIGDVEDRVAGERHAAGGCQAREHRRHSAPELPPVMESVFAPIVRLPLIVPGVRCR